MKKNYLLLCLFPLIGFGQTQTVINQAAADLVYSPLTGKLYLTIPASAATDANTIAEMNLAGVIENTYPIGNDPGVMAISSDGSAIYTGLNAQPGIRKFNVATHEVSDIALGSDALTGNFYAEDIEVSPTNANIVAVSQKNHNFAPRHEGVAIYDNGLMLSNVTQNHTGSNQIEFLSNGQIAGFNTETTESKFRKLTVSATGVVQSSVTNDSPVAEAISSPEQFSAYGTKAYFSNGKVVDFSATPTIVGTIPDVNGPSVYNISGNLICYASTDESGNIALKFFNPATYSPDGIFPLAGVTGKAKSIAIFNNGSFAFNTADKVVIVTFLLGTDQHDLSSVKLYPNPVKDILHVSAQGIKRLDIYNNLGQLVRQMPNTVEDNQSFDMSGLASGTYFVKLSLGENQSVYKLLKL